MTIPKEIKKKAQVLVISGNYKRRRYEIDRVNKDGYVTLVNLQVLSSKKKPISFKIHHSNLKVI